MDIPAHFHVSELLLYFGVYIVYLLYGVWALLSARDDILNISKYEFATGWRLLGRPRDDTNDELENFGQYIASMWPWYVLHVIVSTTAARCWPTRCSRAHVAVSVLALVFTLQARSLAVLSILLFTFFVVAASESKALTWLLAALWVAAINWIKNSGEWHEQLGYQEYFTLIVMLSWCLLRGSSFALTRLKAAAGKGERATAVMDGGIYYNVEQFVGYMLYLPTLVYGPLMEYSRYAVGSCEQPAGGETLPRKLTTLGVALLRVAFWWCCLQVALHHLYLHYMARDIEAVRLVRHTFSNHAVGYFMGQFFFVYYVVTYGLGIALARHDGLRPQSGPRCIGRIHFYSDMWKYFDQGLYEFLFQHIYAELCTSQSPVWRKLLATAGTFGFVYLWHGCYSYVLLWSCLNFACLVGEKCFKAMINSRSYAEFVGRHLSDGGVQRLNALLGTQIFIPAAFSNVYFISGEEVGNYLMRGAYCSGWCNYVALTFCSYCFFQCSELISTRATCKKSFVKEERISKLK